MVQSSKKSICFQETLIFYGSIKHANIHSMSHRESSRKQGRPFLPPVYGLRVTYIVLHACLPVVSALTFVAKDALVFDPISYIFIAISIIGLMVSLSFNFNNLPNSIGGMVKLFLFPLLFIIIAQLFYHEGWIINLAYLTTQELLSATMVSSWLWWQERKPPSTDRTFRWFLGVMASAQIISTSAIYYSAYRLDQSSPNWLLAITVVYMVTSAALEARLVTRMENKLEEKSIN